MKSSLILGLTSLLLFAQTSARAALVLPVHRWSFSGNTLDTGTVGGATGTLLGGASIVGGRLSLDGSNDEMRTFGGIGGVGIGGNKTLVSWVSLSTLNQGSGTALTLQSSNGATFDGIVYGERVGRQWMAGSDFHRRSGAVNNGGALETVTEPGEVMMAITYDTSNNIRIYRNGAFYAGYNDPSFVNYAPSAQAIFGRRHTGGGGAPLAGFINEARIYNVTLDANEIAQIHALGADRIVAVPEPSTLAIWSLLGLVGAGFGYRRHREKASLQETP